MRLIGMATGMGDVRERCVAFDDQPPCTACAGFGAISGGINAVEVSKLARQGFAPEAAPGAPQADRQGVARAKIGGELVGGVEFAACDRFQCSHERGGGGAQILFGKADQCVGIGHAAPRGEPRAKWQSDVDDVGAAGVDAVAMRAIGGVDQHVAGADAVAAGIARLLIAATQDNRGIRRGMAVTRDPAGRWE